MDNSKIKNYIILLLLIVNVCLLSIVLKNSAQERAAKEYGEAALMQVLQENDIALNRDVSMPDKLPTEITLSRSMLKERSKLASIIGNCSAQDLGGNIIYYRGSNGQASCRGTGEFEITLDTPVITEADNRLALCVSIGRKLGIEFADVQPEITEGEKSSIRMTCAWDGTPVNNASIRFDFDGDRLYIISGVRPLDTEVSIKASEDAPDGATVLMNFLAYIRQTDEVFSEITDIEQGYFISSSVSGNCVLRPVWRIATDTGSYYFNGQTGKPENLEYAV